MNRIMLSVVAILALSLASCAPTLQGLADTFGVDVVSASVRENAKKAAYVAFTAWGGPECADDANKCGAGGVQEATLYVGSQPRCGAEGATVVCISDATWTKIKAISLKTTQTLNRARPLLEAGDSDVALFMSLPAAVFDAQTEINAAKKE